MTDEKAPRVPARAIATAALILVTISFAVVWICLYNSSPKARAETHALFNAWSGKVSSLFRAYAK